MQNEEVQQPVSNETPATTEESTPVENTPPEAQAPIDTTLNCPSCKGEGLQDQQTVCPNCHGTGKV